MLIDPQQDAVVITHLITGKGVAACRSQRQHISLGALIQMPFHSCQGQGGKKSLLLREGARLNIHIL